MIDMTWTTTPVLGSRGLVVRPAGSAAASAVAAPAAVPAPMDGSRVPAPVPAARLRGLAAGRPFGAGTAACERHIDDFQKQNTSTFGIHSPGRPLS